MRIRAIALALALVVPLAAASAALAQQGQPPLPPSHPPLGAPPPRPVVTPPPQGSGTGAQGLAWTAPKGWTSEPPSSAMRRAQYKITGPGGPAECVVFYFGPGQGGDAKANIARWASQFRRADGSPVPAPKTREIRVADVPVTTVELAGTYVGGMGSGPASGEKKDALLLGAIATGPDANWFFRAIGPRTTLETQRGAFDAMVRSIKRGDR